MRYLLPMFGTRIQFEPDLEQRTLKLYREFSEIVFDAEIGMELRGGRKRYLLGGKSEDERFLCVTVQQSVGRLTWMGYDETTGLRLQCTMSNTFDPQDERRSLTPAVLFECKAERLRKDPDNVAGKLFFRLRPRKDDIEVESDVRLRVGYRLCETSYYPHEWYLEEDKEDLVHVWDHILPLRGNVKGKGIEQTFFFQYGNNTDTMRFAWCMYDPQTRYRIRKNHGQYYYTYYFKSIYQVEDYVAKEEWKLRKLREERDEQYRIPCGGTYLNEIVAYAVHSFLSNTVYIWESECVKRLLVSTYPEGVYNQFHAQMYALPFCMACYPQMIEEWVREWRENGVAVPVREQKILLFADRMGTGYQMDPKPPETVNVANNIGFLLFFYAFYRQSGDEGFLWRNRDVLHQTFSFLFLDVAEWQYRDLFFTIGKMKITAEVPLPILLKLQMALRIIREFVKELELEKRNAAYIQRLAQLETDTREAVDEVFQRERSEIPYYDISEMVYYHILFCGATVSDLEKEIHYIRAGRKQHLCPLGKGRCQPDEVQMMHYCPYSRRDRRICAEQRILRDVVLWWAGDEGIGNLADYERWIRAEQTKRENGHPLPELLAAIGYLYTAPCQKQQEEKQ